MARPARAARPSSRAVAAGWTLLALAGAAPAGLAQQRFERASISSSGVEGNAHTPSGPAYVSADGRHVAFHSTASNLAAADGNLQNDVFVRDRVAGTTVLLSRNAAGASGNGRSEVNGISEDGRFVVFNSTANDLVAGDSNLDYDVFVCDRDPDGDGNLDQGNSTIVRASVGDAGQQAAGRSTNGSVSSDGRFVAFESEAENLVAGDGNQFGDVFVRDLVAGTTERASVSSLGDEGDSFSQMPLISADGRFVAFRTAAGNLVPGDTNGAYDVVLRDRTAGTTERVSVGESGGGTNAEVRGFTMARDGQRIAWWSWADDVVAGDGNQVPDVFLRDRAAGTTVRASVSDQGVEGDKASFDPHLSANGEWLLFGSEATNLAGIETNFRTDVFLKELATGHLIKLSVHLDGVEGDDRSAGFGISDDGTIAPLYSDSFDLIGGDSNGFFDLLVRDRSVPDPEGRWTNYGEGWPGKLGVPSLELDADPVLGTTVRIELGNSAGFPAVGYFYCGLDAISVPTRLGGTFLVDPVAVMVLLVDAGGTSMSCELPLDEALAGVSVYAQLLLLDPHASRGVAFSPGLEAFLGQ